MSMEQVIKDLTEAMNRQAAAVEESNKLYAGGAAATTKTSKQTAKTDKEAATNDAAAGAEVDKQPQITQPQLLSKIKEVAQGKDKDVARAQFSDLGYEKMADIKPEHYDTVYKRCEAILASSDEL